MNNFTIKFFSFLFVTAAIIFTTTACSSTKGTVLPENLPVEERWGKHADPSSPTTLEYSVADDGLCTITIGGVAAASWVDEYRTRPYYNYSARANTRYIYVLEMWTESGSRFLNIEYYADNEDNIYLGDRVTITNERTKYTIRGETIPKEGIQALKFRCAQQLGTFYIKVLEIREPLPSDEFLDKGRWGKWVADDSSATLDYSIDSDYVVTVNVSGSPELHGMQDIWNRWKASMSYIYTAKANTRYAYVLELWTESGTRGLDLLYYSDHENQIYISDYVTITNERKTYTIIGQTIPKDGVQQLHIQCADQLGTFYLKVIEIREALPNEVPFETIFNRGIQFRNQGNYDSAITEFTEAIRMNPNNEWVLINRGISYKDRGNKNNNNADHDRAIEDFNQAIKLNPNNSWAYRERGSTYSEKCDYNRAIADYNQGILINPNNADLVGSRGYAYKGSGNLDRAIEDFETALKIDPKYLWSHTELGFIYQERGEHDRAIAEFSNAIKIEPGWGWLYHHRGWAYYHRGNPGDDDRALIDFEEGLRLDPNQFDIYSGIGWIYYNRGDYDRAIEAFENAVRLAPDSTRYKDELEMARRRGR